jgi:hypothetical protein
MLAGEVPPGEENGRSRLGGRMDHERGYEYCQRLLTSIRPVRGRTYVNRHFGTSLPVPPADLQDGVPSANPNNGLQEWKVNTIGALLDIFAVKVR